jgi:hypothetical protein
VEKHIATGIKRCAQFMAELKQGTGSRQTNSSFAKNMGAQERSKS